MMPKLIPWGLLLVTALVGTLSALEVDRTELRGLDENRIVFQNYLGPQDSIDSDEEIRSIGAALVASLTEGRGNFGDRYALIRAIDNDAPARLSADILVILDGAQVDHIDNIRRIISGYLESSYTYSRSDADLLALLITIYNAVYHGNYDFFVSRYSPVVLDHLNAQTVGLSTRYSDWPGRTRIVIPISNVATAGRLDAVAPLALTDDRVIESLREQEERGLDERRDIVDLLDRTIDQQIADIATRAAELTRELREIEQIEAEIERELAIIAEALIAMSADGLSPDERSQATELNQRAAELTQRQNFATEQRQEIQQQSQTLEEERQQVAQLTAEVRQQRSEVARDINEILTGREPQGGPSIIFPLVAPFQDHTHARLNHLDRITGELIGTSPLATITNRELPRLGSQILVIAQMAGRYRLATIDPNTLDVIHSGIEDIHPQSSLLVADGNTYAVISDNGQWQLARFDAQLRQQARSTIAVDPLTHILIADGVLYVQTGANRISRLDPQQLNELQFSTTDR